MKTLFKNIDYLATFDSSDRELTKANILVSDGKIERIDTLDIFETEEECSEINCEGKLIIPGMVNTHHHLFQSMFRNVKGAQNMKLFDWLVFLYERWKLLYSDAIYSAATVGIYEMMKTGVTTTSDMFYLYPENSDDFFDREMEAAFRTGVRFHPCRGSMSLSRKDGGLPPDSVVQTEEKIMEECERVVKKYHNPSRYSMYRVALAPCSPFSVTGKLMKDTLEMAEKYDLLVHTHLAETADEDEYCIEKFGLKPVDYMEKLGWLNPRAWFAHCVYIDESERARFAENNVGVSHCPTSNMRLGSGIAPIVEMLKHEKIRLSLAVDGSASNDTGNMLQETRNALLLQRVLKGADSITPREVLKMATLGGAQVLRMDDYIGSLEVGKSADFIAFDLNTLEFAGGLSDPLSALVLCDMKNVDLSIINGKIRIKDGIILDEDLKGIIDTQNAMSKGILERA